MKDNAHWTKATEMPGALLGPIVGVDMLVVEDIGRTVTMSAADIEEDGGSGDGNV